VRVECADKFARNIAQKRLAAGLRPHWGPYSPPAGIGGSLSA